MTFEETPDDLTELEYARGLLDSMGWPIRGNIELIADCITAISKSKNLSPVRAYKYLERAVRLAKQQGMEVNRFWFQGGEYTNVRPDRKALKDYQPIDRERTRQEQSTPEWDESSRKAREVLARIAGKEKRDELLAKKTFAGD